MKTIKIATFALLEPFPADYNHNSEFKQSFGNNPNLKLLKFSVPKDAFGLSYRYWKVRTKHNNHFDEFNKLPSNIFQTIIILEEPITEIELTYVSKDDRIRELLAEIDVYEVKIKGVRREIEKLTQ